jgi:hypothetical protein
MDFYGVVTAFADRAKTLKPHIQSEEATKTALIMPFFQQVLGYDVFNPQEFAPEYKANFRSNGNDRVDFAVLSGGVPVILIEAKYVGESLEQHVGQLSGYYAPTEARFAVLTNGLSYRFYSDVIKSNIMDTVPFLDVDLLALDVRAVAELEQFSKNLFNADTAAARAFELMNENAIYARLSKEIENPSGAFVALLSDSLEFPVERLKPIAKSVIRRYLSDNVIEAAAAPALSEEPADAPQFTAEQLEAMEAVRAVIAGTGSKHRYKVNFFYRKNYCEVNYRKCAVCAFPHEGNLEIKSIRFRGTSVENRRKISEFPLSGASAVVEYAPNIIKQLEFIDWWCLNPKAETGGVE